jgi:hypothetical protein
MVVKKNLFLMFCAFLLSFPITADICIKENVHIPPVYRYGVVGPEQNLITQWWLNDLQAALEIENLRIVLDKKAQQVLVINLARKTYVQMPLPLTTSAHLDENASQVLKFYKIEGTIEKTGKKEKIQKKECRLVVINEKICNMSNQPTYHNKCFYDREQRAMVTTDVSFNWQLKNELPHTLRLFFNPREDYLKQLRQLKGYVYASKNTIYTRGATISYSVKCTEIRKSEAPTGIYGIPAGFKKVQVLTLNEIFQIVKLIYWQGM